MTAVNISFVGTKVRAMDAAGTAWTTLKVAANTANFVEGSGSLSEKTSNTTLQGYSITAADWSGEPWNFSSGGGNAGDHIFMWQYVYEAWDTLANGGFRILAADDLATDSVGAWYVGPQPGYLGGWYCYVVDPARPFDTIVAAGTGSWTTGGNPTQLSGVDGFGAGWKVTKTIAGAIDNCFIDACSVGKGYKVMYGDSTDADAKFSDIITWEDTWTGTAYTNRYGAIRSQSGIIFAKCKLYIGGTGSENTVFNDSGFTVVWEKVVRADGTTSGVADTFYELKLQKGSGTTNVTLANGTLSAVSPHEVYLNLTGVTAVTMTNINTERARLIDMDGAVSWSGGQITNSGLITLSGQTTFNTVSIISPTDSSALKVTNNTHFANCDNLTFTKGAATNHAIEITATGTYDFDNITFSGYASTNGSTGNEAFYNNSGGAVTINRNGGSGTLSVRNSGGSSTTIVEGSRTVSLNVKNSDGTNISDAQVLLYATAGGAFPANVNVSISNSSTTSTVTHTSHGLATNDKVMIKNAAKYQNNGVFTITKVDDNSYSYTTPAAPAGGTDANNGSIKATFVFLSGTTDGSGNISMSRTVGSNTPVQGWARKSSGAPYYKTGGIVGTVSSSQNTSFTSLLIADE